MIGQLTNRYKVLSTLGEGGMGVVFLVEDSATGRQVALKVLSKMSGDAQEALLRFKQEFRTMTRLRHPNTVEVYDYGQLSDGTPFFTMEVVPGKGLDELLPLSFEDFRSVVRQLVRALGYIHRQGLVHCDIKPENIRLTPQGEVKLMDFGLMVDAGASCGTIRGTIAYMSPEVARKGKIDARADLYSLGALSYHLLVGAPPFVGEDPVAILRAHLDSDPPTLGTLLPGVPADLEELVERLLAKDVRARYQSAGELLTALGDSPAEDGEVLLLQSPLVGRQAELELLSGGLAQVKKAAAEGGGGGQIWLSGDLGIGKTRLLEEFRFQVQLAEVSILSGKANLGDAPYGPFIEVLRGLLPLVPPILVDHHRGLLARLLPELDDGGEVVRLEPNQEQYRLRSAFSELMSEAAKTGLVLILDDWHWADELSSKLLAHLTRNLSDRPFLTVIAGREISSDLPAVPLEPLSDAAVAEMVHAMLGSSEVAPEFLAAFTKITSGSPLYVESSLRHLCETGVIAADQGRWVARFQLTARHLPGSIIDLLKERLDRLSASALSVARAAAAVGRACSLPLLAKAAAMPEEVLFESLEELRGAGILAAEEGKVAFLQGQLNEVLLADLPAGVSLQLHTRIAHALEEQHEEGLQATNELARHFLRSTDRRKAAIAALAAGNANLGLYALAEASEFLEAGLPLVDGGDRPVKMEYLYGLATLARFRSDLDLAETRYRSALDLAEELSEGRLEAKTLTSLGIIKQIRNHNDAAIELLTRSAAVCERVGDQRELMRCLQTMARVYYKKADPIRAIETCERARDLARQAGDRLDDSGPLAFLGFMFGATEVPGLDTPSRIQRGVLYLQEAIEKRRKLGDKVGINDSLNLLGNALWSLGKYQEARATFEENLAVAIEISAKNDEICCRINLAMQFHELGDFKLAEMQSAKAAAESVETKSDEFAIIADILRSVAVTYLGRPTEGQRLEASALAVLDVLPPEGRAVVEVQILPYVAERQLFCGQVLAALTSTERAWQLTEETGVRLYEQRILTLLGEIHARLAEPEAARSKLQEALELGSQFGSLSTIARAQMWLAWLAMQSGDLVEALSACSSAQENAIQVGTMALAGEVALLRGRILLAQGQRGEANAGFEAAFEVGESTGCPQLRAMALFGQAWSQNRSTQAYRLLRSAQSLQDSQLKGLDEEERGDFLSIEERWRVNRGDLSLESFGLEATSVATTGGLQRQQQLERNYLEALSEVRQLRTELEDVSNARDRLERLLSFTAQTNHETDLDRLLDGIMQLIGQMVEADRGFLLIREGDRDGQPFTVRSTYKIDQRDRRPQTWQFSRSISDRVIETGESIFLQDTLENDAMAAVRSIMDLNVRTVLCVPLQAASRAERRGAENAQDRRIIGVIYLDRQSVNNAFQRRDLVMVEALAAQATQAIENARLHSDANDKAIKLERLNELAREVSTSLDLPWVLGKVVEKTLEHTEAERAFIFLKGTNGKLECRLAKDADGTDITAQEAQVSTTITRQVLETGKPVCELDTQNSEAFQAQKSILDLELRTVMCVPFRMPRSESSTKRREDKRHRPREVESREPRDEFHGVLYVDSKVVVNAFTSRDVELLQSIAHLASSAIYNASLYEKATVDAMTGLYFRSFFLQRLEDEVGRARRISSPLSVLMGDIDHFKRFNDTYGHATGDDVLRLVAKTIKGNIREEDIAARFGGEEMLVMMPDTPLDGAAALAERLRSAIEDAGLLGPNGEDLHVSISIGVAQLGDIESPNEMIEHADQAMYQAKHGGRNRVELAG